MSHVQRITETIQTIETIDENALVHWGKAVSLIWAILMTTDIISTQIDLAIGHGLIEGNELMTNVVQYPCAELIGKYVLVVVVFWIFFVATRRIPETYRNYFWIGYICIVGYVCVYFGYFTLNNVYLGMVELFGIGML